MLHLKQYSIHQEEDYGWVPESAKFIFRNNYDHYVKFIFSLSIYSLYITCIVIHFQ